MKVSLLSVLFASVSTITFAKNIPLDLDNHKKLVEFVESTVIASEARQESCEPPHGQKRCVGYSREDENKKEYLAITTLGEGKETIFTDSLVNLSMVRMGTESYNLIGYYLFNRGRSVLSHLATLSPAKIVAHCHAIYNDLSRKEIRGYRRFTISGVKDLKVEDICYDQGEAESTLEEIIYEIKKGKIVLDDI